MTTSPSQGPLRRHAAKIALVALLSLPALVGAWRSGQHGGENRTMAALPAVPTDWAGALALPAKTDAWINDHFGFRDALLLAHNRLRYSVFDEFPSVQVTRGRHGRFFLTSHNASSPPFSAVTSVCRGGQFKPGTPEYINRLFRDFHAMGLDPRMLIVPSAPVVMYEDLPRWLEAGCASSATPFTELLAGDRLDPEVRRATLYPLAQMREIKQRATLFPKNWFHWNGPGLDEVAQLTLPMWGHPLGTPAPAFPIARREGASDVANLFEGIGIMATMEEADFAAAGVASCYGGRCFPEFEEYAETLYDISRFHNPKAPKRRLVMLTDSFGSKISGWYARYYDEVEQVATNNISQLSAGQIARLKAYLFRDRENMDLLILYHDGGASTGTLQYGLERFHEKP
ncbi:hypothetical protein JOD97_004850 [Duganella sp. 1411]|uniref:hypothetical protein n=1 Tax=Duganella sp. 1411 TaxID=2806572 RepID=UPI001AE94C04|nr:hypothetical protein [Duganella sp. 1411]MBP1206774.1 hypothetical protein [Duganella sp. 1411]